MTATTGANTLAVMPAHPKKPAMSHTEFQRLVAESGWDTVTKGKLAQHLGVARSHVYRWWNNESNIDEASALLIRDKLKTPPST